MTLRAFTAIAALAFSSIASGQTPQFTDPANLRGERVKPRDGRELPIDQGTRGLEQMLRKLNTRASLMLIVAHPDDEDGGMLTYYSRGFGARVAMLTLTRGEGGQNAVTGDFEDALGLLRTQELLSADRYLGVDQFFGTEVDFGFSKTKEEAFKKWTHERVLYDAVRAIRLYHPLVIAAVFIGGVTDGHGQHQVSGQIAQEAFKAAADPTVFPDMIAEGILPWQALKVYARVPMQSISDKGLFDYATGKYAPARFENYVTGEITTTTPSADVIVHEGTVDKLLSDNPSDPPRTYVQFARIGLGMQKSQIGGGVRVPPAGAFDISYHLYGSALCSDSPHLKECHPERSAQREVEGPASSPGPASPDKVSSHNPESASFFDGIDVSIEGIAHLAPHLSAGMTALLSDLASSIAHASTVFAASSHLDDRDRQLLAEALTVSLKDADVLIAGVGSAELPASEKADVLHELRTKRVQINNALVFALGLELKSTASSAEFITNQKIEVHAHLAAPYAEPLELSRLYIANGNGSGYAASTHEAPASLRDSHPVDSNIMLGSPLTSEITRPYFHRENIEQPFYDLTDRNLRNASVTPPAIVAGATVQYNNARIELQQVVEHASQPIQFVPSGSLSLSSHAQVVPSSASTTLRAFLTTASEPTVTPSLSLPPGWTSVPAAVPANTADEIRFTITPPTSARKPAIITASAPLPDGTITAGYRPIGYGDLPRTNYYTPAIVRIVPVDLNLPSNKKIAYLPGTGDAVPEALASINLKPEILTVADLTPAKLAQFDSVILGVRTYAAHPDLHGAPTEALFDFARNGGNVLVQYQTTEFTAEDAPYPLSLGSNEKVVDEADPVQLLDTKAAFLTTPNKITPADFNNWVEERGHGFLSEWDTHYTALTETHDPDQDPQRGGLITTSLGKGRWTYCAFALYRQLPEAVPGAFRLFVNLITPGNGQIEASF